MTTHITLLCDRSGSMNSIRADAEGAVNRFIEEQKAQPDDCTITLADFDAPGAQGDWLRIVHQGPLADCPRYVLQPRGSTALLDAVGMTITSTGEYLAALPEASRPEHVFFVVQTDGEENSSRDWRLENLQKLIKQQTDEWSWEFIFLGMGPDTFHQGRAMGFAQNTRSADSADAYVGTYAVASSHVAQRRAGGQGLNLNVDVDDQGNITERSEP